MAKKKDRKMTLPRFEPSITLGNVLSTVVVLLVNLVIVVAYLATDHASIKTHDKDIAKIQDERRDNLKEIRGGMETVSKRVQVVEDWIAIEPKRFTPVDANLLKAQAVAEANAKTAEEFKEFRGEIARLTGAFNELNIAVREHIAATQNTGK